MFLSGDTMDIVNDALFVIFNNTIDFGIYALIDVIFNVFFVLAKLDLFGSTALGQQLYEALSQRIYMIISIVMVFIFAYNLLLYVMQPDGRYVKDQMKPTAMLKRIVFSMVMLILMPLIFRYMSLFQNHVLASDTIPAMILGKEQGVSRVMTRGKRISMMTWMTFVHPVNKTYGDYINDYDAESCSEYFVSPSNDNFSVTEQGFVQSLIDNCEAQHPFWTTLVMKKSKTWSDNEHIEKFPIISSIAGIILLVFGIGYVYSIAGRLFRLFALQIFAPVPIMMRMFKKENFDNWFKDLLNTYIDVFVRVAVISFILFMCTILPDIINSINTAVLNEILLG
ncbi:MAG: hypothetical protein IKP76_01205 [Bacilli bacterium]|nr:hypothetical protein [Bacilli bacterium]